MLAAQMDTDVIGVDKRVGCAHAGEKQAAAGK